MSVGSVLQGAPYPYRDNSLNMFRLILAAMVLFAHSWYIAGQGVGPQLHGENLGGWAVAGFFVLSGFLITRSRFRTGPGDYLLHRIARIFPGFLVCLVVVAFGFAPVAALLEHGTLAGFLSTPVTPLEYIWGNSALHINHYTIGTTLDTVPYPGAWNGSLWTLYYEFLCYVAVWLLGGLAIFRRSPSMVFLVFVASVLVWIAIPLFTRLGLNADFMLFAKLFPFFMGGSLVYLIVDRWGLSRVIAWASIVAAGILVVFVPTWGGQIAAPFIAYSLLYLSTIIRQPRWIAKNDISYGFYIYAWPIQQLFFLLGAAAWGMPFFIVSTVVGTVVLAMGSWYAIERPMMRRVRGSRPLSPARAPSL